MRIKKIITYGIIGLLLIGNVFSFAYAQGTASPSKAELELNCKESNICNAPSNEFIQYTNFVIEVIGALKGYKQNPDVGFQSTQSFGLFQSEILDFPQEAVDSARAILQPNIDKALRGADAIWMQSLIGARIGVETVGDSLMGFSILFKNKPFVRDWQTLLEIDASVHSLIYDLGLDNKWTKTLDPDVYKELKKIFEKYQSEDDGDDKIFSLARLEPGTKYSNVASTLLRLNLRMKGFISKPWKSLGAFWNDMENKDEQNIARGGGDGMNITINAQYIYNMELSYWCGRGTGKCSDNKFFENMGFLRLLGKDSSDSWQIIKDASERFGDARRGIVAQGKEQREKSEGENKLSVRQIELLRTVYGIDTTKLSLGQGLGLSDLFGSKKKRNDKNVSGPEQAVSKSTEGSRVNTEEERQSLWDKIREYRQDAEENKEDIKKIKEILGMEDNKVRDEIIQSLTSDDYREGFIEIALSTKTAHLKQNENIALMENASITPKFREIGVRIQTLEYDVIGSKDSEGIIKYLGETCELQCSNKGNTNCYAK